jgi:hypothetical protein
MCSVVKTNWESEVCNMVTITAATASDDDDVVVVMMVIQGCTNVQVYSTTFTYLFTHPTAN